MMFGPKVLLPPTDATDCYVVKQLSQSCKHSESAEMLDFQAFRYFLMFGRVPRSKSRLCWHNSILDLRTLVSVYHFTAQYTIVFLQSMVHYQPYRAFFPVAFFAHFR